MFYDIITRNHKPYHDKEPCMKIDQFAFNQIASSLAGHFDSMFYVEIESGNYVEFIPTRLFEEFNIPKEGEDFFALSQNNAHK